MKKVITLFCAAVLCVCFFSGCGAKEANLSEVMDKINSSYDVKDLTKLTDVNDLNTYYGIDVKDVKQFAAEINTDSSKAPVEIVLVEANDASAAQNINTKLSARYNSIYSQYASYSAEEVAMVKDCKVTVDGNYVTMIVADKAPEMLEIFYSNIK